MTPLDRPSRVAVALWTIVAIVVWNGLYDLLLARSTLDYLFRTAIHEAGLGPAVDLRSAMDAAVLQAVWLSTLWSSVFLGLGLVTVRLVRPWAATAASHR
jgi:hypothetical protein